MLQVGVNYFKLWQVLLDRLKVVPVVCNKRNAGLMRYGQCCRPEVVGTVPMQMTADLRPCARPRVGDICGIRQRDIPRERRPEARHATLTPPCAVIHPEECHSSVGTKSGRYGATEIGWDGSARPPGSDATNVQGAALSGRALHIQLASARRRHLRARGLALPAGATRHACSAGSHARCGSVSVQ